MKRKIRALVALLLLLLCPALGACGGAGGTKDAVSLWVAEGQPLAGELARLAADYNAPLGRKGTPVEVRSFADEAALAAAFDTARPDLLLCSHERAFSLYASGALSGVVSFLGPDTPSYPEALALYSPCIGQSYFPLGFEAQLLYARPEAGSFDRLPALSERAEAYGAETGLPFLTADSFSGLLYEALLSQGTQLHGLRQLDLAEENYVNTYNQLAQAAYTGGLAAFEAPAAELVEAGYVSCAALASSALAGRDLGDRTVTRLPRMEDGDIYLARGWGLAFTARPGRERPAADFLAWLCAAERPAEAALSGGLVPALAVGSMEGGSPLAALLLEISRTQSPHLPEAEADFVRNREALEAELRQAAALLRG